MFKKVVGILVLMCGLSVTVSALATPTAPTAAAIAECGVYPQTFHKNYLHKVKPLHSAYWDTDASVLLGSTFAQSRVQISSGYNNFGFVSWLNPNGSTAELDAAYADRGLLGHGFNEAVPPPDDSVANGQINHQLEVGDWLIGLPASTRPSPTILDHHIAAKTILLLPLHDRIAGAETNQSYHHSHLVRVRLLDYQFSGGEQSMTFVLIDPSPLYTCFRFDDQATVDVPVSLTQIMPDDPEELLFIWSFGDGTISTLITPTHTYTQAGTYTVSLTTYPLLDTQAWPPEWPPYPDEVINTPFTVRALIHVNAVVPRWSIWIPSLRQD